MIYFHPTANAAPTKPWIPNKVKLTVVNGLIPFELTKYCWILIKIVCNIPPATPTTNAYTGLEM